MHLFNKTLLAAAMGGLVTLPLFAQDQLTLGDDSVSITDGIYEIQMKTWKLNVMDISDNSGTGMDIFGMGTIKDGFYQTYLSQTGIHFPDQSEQRSAAYSKSYTDAVLALLAPTEAWPMVCKTTVLDGNVPIDLSFHVLFCRSPQSGVPGGHIGSTAGVPDGFFFVVTDVLATCGLGSNCDGVDFTLARRNKIEHFTDLERWKFPLSSTTPTGSVSVAVQFAGPLMILEPGDYLVGAGGFSTSGVPFLYAQVMGYLTANPERFGR